MFENTQVKFSEWKTVLVILHVKQWLCLWFKRAIYLNLNEIVSTHVPYYRTLTDCQLQLSVHTIPMDRQPCLGSVCLSHSKHASHYHNRTQCNASYGPCGLLTLLTISMLKLYRKWELIMLVCNKVYVPSKEHRWWMYEHGAENCTLIKWLKSLSRKQKLIMQVFKKVHAPNKQCGQCVCTLFFKRKARKNVLI